MTNSQREALERLEEYLTRCRDVSSDTLIGAGTKGPVTIGDLRQIRAALATPARQDAPDGWRPIKSAPKDAYLLLSDGAISCDIGRFDALDGWTASDGCPLWPTLWMPLPPPPGGAR